MRIEKYFFILIVAAVLCGCGVSYYEKSADREVSSILKEKQQPAEKGKIKSAGLEDETRKETVFLTLKDALILAAKNNR
ncbi:MAG: hypothetical protein ACP5QD_00630, partial [Candidatus Ratteibacteria bacterium]